MFSTAFTYMNRLDPNAQAFITAAGITSTLEQNAINNLVIGMKSFGLWNLMSAVYPMVGSSSNSQSYNLIDPSLYRLTFQGGWTHGVTGAYPNGTDGVARTGLNPSTVLTADSTHLSFYSLNDTKSGVGTGRVDIGCQTGTTTSFFVTNSSFNLYIAYFYTNASGNRIQIANGNKVSGFFLTTRSSSSSLRGYSTNYTSSTSGFELISTITTTGGSLPNNEVYICANGQTGNIYEYSNRGCGFASIGKGLSDSNVTNFNNVVSNFVTALGRNV